MLGTLGSWDRAMGAHRDRPSAQPETVADFCNTICQERPHNRQAQPSEACGASPACPIPAPTFESMNLYPAVQGFSSCQRSCMSGILKTIRTSAISRWRLMQLTVYNHLGNAPLLELPILGMNFASVFPINSKSGDRMNRFFNGLFVLAGALTVFALSTGSAAASLPI